MPGARTPLLEEPAAVPGRTVAFAVALSLFAACVFYATLLLGGSLTGIDWTSHHYHYFDWVRISLREHHTLPLYMADAWVTPNFLGNAEAPSLGPLVGLLWLLPTEAYIKLLIVIFTAVGLAGMFFLLRDFGVESPIAAPFAVVFGLNGFFVSHLTVGHHWVMGALLLPLFLLWARRALLGSNRCLVLAAALNAFTIAGGQHQPFIWQNLLFLLLAALWAGAQRSLRPLARGALLLLLSFGLGAVKILPMLAEFADYAPTQTIQGLPPSLLLWSLTAGGQVAATMQPAVVFEHGAGWWEYAFYVGPIAVAALVLGWAGARRAWPLLVAGLFFLYVGLDWRGGLHWLDPWPLLSELPVWRTQRAPSRLLFIALFSGAVAAAVGFQQLKLRLALRWSRAALWYGCAIVLVVGVDLFFQARPWQRASVGEPIASLDHKPRPLRVSGRTGVTAELVEFSPNRLVYRVDAPASAHVVLPLRYGEGWRAEGLKVSSSRDRLAVEVPAGRRDVAVTYRPPLFFAGIATTALTLVWVGTVAVLRRRARQPPMART